MVLSFYVKGTPRPAGSKRAFPIRRLGVLTGKIAVVDANPLSKDWKATVANAASNAMDEAGITSPMAGPLRLVLTFHMQRPKGHFNSKGELKKNAPTYHISKPDTLKLTRAIEDACNKIVWNDDSQIACEHMTKIYGDTSCGVLVAVETIGSIQNEISHAD